YGKVADVYIPLKKSKIGKKFSFVCFLKVNNIERLIENLCTIWIGRFHLHANPVRFQRESRASFVQPTKEKPTKEKVNVGPVKNSFASVSKFNSHVSSPSETTPAIVMDDSCIDNNSCTLMGKIKDINGLSNIYVILADEGRIYWIRVKELEAWSLEFNNEFNKNSSSDEESVEDGEIKSFQVDDADNVSESSYMKENNEHEIPNSVSKKGTVSTDPFGIYTILKRNNQEENSKGDDLSFPSGFTLKDADKRTDEEANASVNKSHFNPHCNKNGVSSGKCGSNRSFNLNVGGSILDVMEDLIEIGLGHPSKKDWIRDLNMKHRVNFATIQETKTEKIDLFTIKALWDSFVVVRGTWIASSLRLMFVSVYAPQDVSDRKTLWKYITYMINSWDGECVILEDFNEIIQQDVVNAVKEFFFSSSKFPLGSNSLVIALIPKSLEAKMVKYFRPISLIGRSSFSFPLESLDISFNNILNARMYKGIRIDDSLSFSHLFYVDDAVFIGKWDKANVITIVNMLECFYLASGLKINIHKSKIMGIGTSYEEVDSAARIIGCNTFSLPFNYLGVKVGSSSSKSKFWDEDIAKLLSRLSKWCWIPV
nr:RNA-directed DNA polymerase, eukaryota [Tanacetum cinerariifolium]